MVVFLLPFPADGVDVIVVVVIGWHWKCAVIGVVLVVAEALLQQLLVSIVVLHDIGLGVSVGIVLWGLADSFLVWLVVLRYLQNVARISGGRIPWYCR